MHGDWSNNGRSVWQAYGAEWSHQVRVREKYTSGHADLGSEPPQPLPQNMQVWSPRGEATGPDSTADTVWLTQASWSFRVHFQILKSEHCSKTVLLKRKDMAILAQHGHIATVGWNLPGTWMQRTPGSPRCELQAPSSPFAATLCGQCQLVGTDLVLMKIFSILCY